LFVFVFCFFFCWQLLICENTLIQVVKLKKKKFLSSLGAEPGTSAAEARFLVIFEVDFNTYFLLPDKLPISMNMLVFFLENVFGTP